MQDTTAYGDITDSMRLSQHYLELGRCLYIDLDHYEKADIALSQTIELLEPSPVLTPYVQQNVDMLAEVPLEQWPDKVLGLAYWYRGYIREHLDYCKAEQLYDFRQAHARLPMQSDIWYQLAHLLSQQTEPADIQEGLAHTERFVAPYLP